MPQIDFSQFRQVGEFPDPKRRLIRAPKNPLDRCTIISLYPRDIDEYKPTIEPGRFVIAAGTYDKPSRLVVGPSSWWKDIDVDQPMVEIPHSSVQIANSVITDYCNGMFGCNMSDAMPGFFYVYGDVSIVDIRLKYKEKLDETNEKQNKWFNILLLLADALWANSDGNPMAISNEMRLAAKMLGQENKPWLKDFQIVELVKCIACGSLRNPNYPVCQMCKAIDPNHPLSKDLKFAV